MGRSKESPSEPGVPQSIGDAIPRDEASTEAFVAPEVDQAAQVSASRRNCLLGMTCENLWQS